jgi:NTP pyrophosphatase (non-canonical NTP hydrolase)
VDELIYQIEEWSKDRFLDKADSSKQFLKVTEEVGEVARSLARSDQEGLKDGIGDVVVTLIILGQQNGLSLEECLQCAYNEIKERKGEMVNGIFVKEDDLVGG